MKFSCTRPKLGSLISDSLSTDTQSLVKKFMTIEELQSILDWHEINYDEWGKCDSKCLQSLLREITRGITDLKLCQNKFVRTVIVARVHVHDGKGNKLIEQSQKFLDSDRVRIRSHHDHINKKVKYVWQYDDIFERYYPPEPVPKAARRALVEELTIPSSEVDRIQYNCGIIQQVTTTSSRSYPGLSTDYYLCNYNVNLGNHPNLVKPHYEWSGKEMLTTFTWKPMADLDSALY
jgi:hypothetical protein